jgi:hypothetical protein
MCDVMDPQMVLACYPYDDDDGNLAEVFAARHVRYVVCDCVVVYV